MKMIKNNSAVKADTTSDLWEKMNKLTVGECFFQIRNGANIKQGVADGGFPITRIETIANDRFNRDRMGYAGITDADKYQSYILEDGDLLMSHINSVQYLGRTVLYHKEENEKIIHGMNLLAMKANRDILNPAYAQYYFRSIPFREQIRQITKKSVNQASFTVSDLKKLPMQVPSLLEQCNAVETLDRVNKLLELHQHQLQKLDELIKARFVEMFGDPLLDDGRYCKAPLGCLAQVGSSKRIFEKEYVSEGIPFYRTKEIVELSNGNKISTELFITPKRYNEIRDEYGVPQAGDLLISAVGTIGVIWIVDGKNDFYFKDGNLLRVANSDNFMPVYLKCLLETLICAHKSKMSSGTAYAALTISTLKEMSVYKVPLAEQSQFSTFVSQVDKSKVAVQKSLDEAQHLFDCLMQEYFS